MFEKSYITDCEGPLTLNDNAFEMAAHFINQGDELFKILSLYDDYLVDIVKKPNYKAGNTLKLILPFFIAEGIRNEDMIKFSIKNIFLVNDSKLLLDYIKNKMNTYIVSTSYGQYIEALANYMDFPFENTYYTDVNIDNISIKDDEINKINEFKELILDKGLNYEILDDIFFNQMPQMSFYNEIANIDVIGGKGKELAIKDIINKFNINQNNIFYIGDSITDVEPLHFAKEHNGISISFNGNKYSINEAEIAIVSLNALPSIIVADIYCKYDKNKVLEFINKYNNSKDLEKLFEEFNVDSEISLEFFNKFKNKDYPLIKIISDENKEEILDKSSKMRNLIRGKDIGELG